MALLGQQDTINLPLICQINMVDIGRVLFGVIERAHKKEDAKLKEKPMICDDDFKKDIKYKLGYVA